MTGGLTRRPYDCPGCGRQVWLRDPIAVPTSSGSVIVDAQPLVLALQIHRYVGCEAA